MIILCGQQSQLVNSVCLLDLLESPLAQAAEQGKLGEAAQAVRLQGLLLGDRIGITIEMSHADMYTSVYLHIHTHTFKS